MERAERRFGHREFAAVPGSLPVSTTRPAPARRHLPWNAGLVAGLLLLALAAPATAAPKTDVIVLLNGDHLTGEIKGMNRGRVDFKTDDAGRPTIEWSKIASVTSIHLFHVELGSGEKLFGVLGPGSEPGTVVVGTEPGTQVRTSEVVLLAPVDEALLQRLRAYLDLGFSFAKSNSVLGLSSDGEVAYRGQTIGVTLYAETYFQKTEASTAVGKYIIRPSGFYDFGSWRALVLGSLDHNDELDLSLRMSVAAGPSFPVVRNSWTELWLTAGLGYDREQYTGVDPSDNLSAYLAGTWEAFRFDTPTLDLEIQLVIQPLITDPGRVRGTSSVNVKYELFKDFKVGLNLSYQFDNRPPLDAPHHDYVLSFTIGWSYRR